MSLNSSDLDLLRGMQGVPAKAADEIERLREIEQAAFDLIRGEGRATGEPFLKLQCLLPQRDDAILTDTVKHPRIKRFLRAERPDEITRLDGTNLELTHEIRLLRQALEKIAQWPWPAHLGGVQTAKETAADVLEVTERDDAQ